VQVLERTLLKVHPELRLQVLVVLLVPVVRLGLQVLVGHQWRLQFQWEVL
jgi:hypothetical protein